MLLTVRDRNGSIIQETQIGQYDWSEGIRPQIDDSATSRQLGAMSIEGVEVNLTVLVRSRWRNTYDIAGELLELQDLD